MGFQPMQGIVTCQKTQLLNITSSPLAVLDDTQSAGA